MFELLGFMIKLPFILLGAVLSLVFGLLGAILSLLSGLWTVFAFAVAVLFVAWVLVRVLGEAGRSGPSVAR